MLITYRTNLKPRTFLAQYEKLNSRWLIWHPTRNHYVWMVY